MDLRIEHAPIHQQPAPGWHRIEQDRLAYCSSAGNAFCIQFFRPNQVDEFNPAQMAAYEARARRLAWACLAEFGAPGPSSPAGLKPPAR